ncbi:MAG: hypothetical protein ABI759_32540 [Candidatus Solibacter sp.]
MIALSALLLTGAAFADDDSRAKLIGKWQQSDGNADAKATWTLAGVPAESIRATNSSGAQTIAEFECNTMGKECEVKDAGRKTKVSMWFNGAKLVVMETRGDQVAKRRFAIAGDGDTMDLETIPIVPSGKVEITHFKRIASVSK